MATALETLFGEGRPTAELVKAAADYKTAVDVAPSTVNGEVEYDIETRMLRKTEKLTGRTALTKAFGGVDASAMAAIEAAVSQSLGADFLAKDITTTSPVPAGLTAFDLEHPAKMLAPMYTPWRNKFPRQKGIGQAHRFKRITGITGSGTGGLSALHPGFSDSVQTNFANPGSSNPTYYNRPQKISYAGDDTILPYVEFGFSSQQSWFTYFTAVGFQDTRELDRQSTLYSSMLGEERVLLYGRGTQSGYAGVISAPGTPTGAARTLATGESGLSGVTTNVYVAVVAESGEFGVSQASAISSGISTSNNQVVDATVPAAISGATGYKFFVGTGGSTPAKTAMYLYTGPTFPGNISKGRTPTLTATLQGALPTSGPTLGNYGGIDLTANDGNSAIAQSYDGVIPWIHVAAGQGTGYVGNVNGTLSTSNPGVEFQEAFATTFTNTKADPDEVWLAGQDANQLSNALRGQESSNYRFQIMGSEVAGITLGGAITSIVNQTKQHPVKVLVHEWMPQGNAVILQNSITVPGVNVPNCWSLFNVQDYMAIDWPVTGFSYDCSVYWTSTLAAYAPDRSSMLTGIQPTV